MIKDWGNVFELDAAAILTTYVTPAAVTAYQFGARTQRRRYGIVASLIGGTNITAVVAKVQAGFDGTNWVDVASVDAATVVAAVEQTYNTIVANKINGTFYVDGGFPYMRVALKVTGGVGQALETLILSQLDTEVTATPIEGVDIAASAIGTVKIADAAVTTVKLADDNVTAAKIDDVALNTYAFTGHNGAGACTLTGAKVGDKVRGVVSITDGTTSTSSFEATITVVDQVQQSSASDLSTKKFAVLLLKRG